MASLLCTIIKHCVVNVGYGILIPYRPILTPLPETLFPAAINSFMYMLNNNGEITHALGALQHYFLQPSCTNAS